MGYYVINLFDSITEKTIYRAVKHNKRILFTCISNIVSNLRNLVRSNATERKSPLPVSMKVDILNYSKLQLDMFYNCLVLISLKYIYLKV
jgi:hypothetical protein